MSEEMRVREFRDRMKESLDEFVKANNDSAESQTAGDWLEDFIEFVSEDREAPPDGPGDAPKPPTKSSGGILDLLDVITGEGEED